MTLFLLLCLLTFKFFVINALNISFTTQPEDLKVREGEEFTLSCNVTVGGGEENATIDVLYTWNKDGRLFTNETNVVSISSADASHGGVYVCVVSLLEERETVAEKSSRNATVTVIISGEDTAPLIAMIVCTSTVGILFIIFLIFIGIYMYCKKSESNSGGEEKELCSCLHQQKKHRQRRPDRKVPVPGKLSPSVPKHFLKGTRAKSSSLSELMQSDFPLDPTLKKSSKSLLSGSQPTQTTDIEDPSTLDFDLVLDEDMFREQKSLDPSNGNDSASLKLTRASDVDGRRIAYTKQGVGRGEAKRRASEGMLVFPESNAFSLRSILKESKSYNENLNNQRRNSVVSDMSSDITQSDDNSLHLGKSVRFNVSGDEWGEDSGVQTGNSTPHNIVQLKRRSSEPETSGIRFNNNERRGSAPGDLDHEICIVVEHDNTERMGEIDEGVETKSEEWTQQEKDFNFVESQAEKRFEGVFTTSTTKDEERDIKNERPDAKSESSGIATRVAQLLSASQTQVREGFTRGPSSLTTTSHTATVSKLKVAEMKERFLQKKNQLTEEATTGREEGRRPSVSKLVQERAEVFKKNTTEDIDVVSRTGSLKRAHRKAEEKAQVKKIKTTKKSSVKAKEDKSLPDTNSFSLNSNPLPVFSGPSGLSNWVPACLRDTVISPYQSYSQDEDQTNKLDDSDSDNEGDDEIIMEPLQPMIGRTLTGPSIGGVASISPIGRSWLSSGKSFGLQTPPLLNQPIMPGAEKTSPFNESISRQPGQRLSASIKRLSVIPEETASACGSITNMQTQP